MLDTVSVGSVTQMEKQNALKSSPISLVNTVMGAEAVEVSWRLEPKCSARYDLNIFSQQQLKVANYSPSRTVHRIADSSTRQEWGTHTYTHTQLTNTRTLLCSLPSLSLPTKTLPPMHKIHTHTHTCMHKLIVSNPNSERTEEWKIQIEREGEGERYR